MPQHPVIDADGHVMEPDDLWVRYMPEAMRARAPRVDPANALFVTVDGVETPRRELFSGNQDRFERNIKGARRFEDANRDRFSARSQLDGMDVEGITASVLFPSRGLAVMGVDGVDPAVTTAAAHAYNSWLADYAAEDPRRLVGAGMADPRDVDAAVAQARRAVDELGFVAVFLRPNPVGGRAWHDPAYEPLWSAMEELDAPVCFHEGTGALLPQVGTDRFDKHGLWHCVCHPVENQMAMMSVVMGGVAERHPGLRFAFLECGAGWLPYWMWRMDEHVENEPQDFAHLTMEPSAYVERQCFVSIDTDEEPGMLAIEALDGPHVVWGSDYPHSDSKFPNAFKILSSLPGMSAERLQRVVHQGPLELFGERLARTVDAGAGDERARP
jgi:predicted TIM-barrel fold metal-dependent hydrolase